jgi:hypothetical protein
MGTALQEDRTAKPIASGAGLKAVVLDWNNLKSTQFPSSIMLWDSFNKLGMDIGQGLRALALSTRTTPEQVSYSRIAATPTFKLFCLFSEEN